MKINSKILLAFVISLLSVLAGCAGQPRLVWDHPQIESQDFENDASGCKADSYQPLPSYRSSNGQSDLTAFAAGVERARAANARDQQFNFCMRRLGWYLTKAR